MNRDSILVSVTIASGLAAPWSHAAAAGEFAPVGTKATLSVEYRFESSGKLGQSKDKSLDLHEWQVRRQVEMSTELVAGKPLPMAMMQAPDAAQTALIQQQGAQMQKAQKDMAPMMAKAEEMLAKCGEDEKCLEREAMKMGAAMSGTPELERAKKTGAETAAVLQPGAPRYQGWQYAGTLKGHYVIEQRSRIVHADPGCMVIPGGRCKRQHVGKGEGAVPQPPRPITMLGAEVDTQAGTLTLQLLPPPMPLPYTDTVTSDEPKGTQVVPPGTHPRQANLRLAPPFDKPLTVALKGGWRSQQGGQTVPVKGDAAEGGKLSVRWRFTVH